MQTAALIAKAAPLVISPYEFITSYIKNIL
jgi:hypothetical protein